MRSWRRASVPDARADRSSAAIRSRHAARTGLSQASASRSPLEVGTKAGSSEVLVSRTVKDVVAGAGSSSRRPPSAAEGASGTMASLSSRRRCSVARRPHNLVRHDDTDRHGRRQTRQRTGFSCVARATSRSSARKRVGDRISPLASRGSTRLCGRGDGDSNALEHSARCNRQTLRGSGGYELANTADILSLCQPPRHAGFLITPHGRRVEARAAGRRALPSRQRRTLPRDLRDPGPTV
jgi:hypothetical protein